MYLAPKVLLFSSSEMHNEHHEGCALTVQLIYGPPWCQWGWGKWWPLLRNGKWIQILESLSCFTLLDLLCRKYPGAGHRSSRRINQLLRTRAWCLCWVTEQLWCLERQEFWACLSSTRFLRGGGHSVAGKLPSLALLLPAKSSRKKLLSFQILAKKEFLHLDNGHKNTELM